MEQIFLKVLNISISASILIVVVIAARLLLKKAPKWCVMLLWAIVALRLMIPVSIESAFSLIPRGMDEKIESIEAAVIDRNTDQVQIPQAEANNMPVTVTGDIQEDVTYIPYEIVEITEPVKPELSIFEIAGYIWIAGVGLMLMFSLFSYIKLKHRMAESVKYKDNIYLSDRTATAFILGMIRPRIYLPSGIDEEERPYVMAHEYSHIKRGDHLWKPLAYLLLCVYWFNPLMWLAYSLLSRDIEYACDEKTISRYDMKDRKAYAAALLENSIQKKLVMVCPLAFGEGSIKDRVKNVLGHKKPAFWICIVSLAVVAIVGICFATKPKNDGDTVAQKETGDIAEDESLSKSQETGNDAGLVASQDNMGSETTISLVDETEGSERLNERELLSVDRLSAKALPEYKNDDYFICSCEVSATQISYVVEFDELVEGDRIVEIYFRKADGSLVTLQQLAGNVTEIKFWHEGDPDFKRYRYTQDFSSMINLSSIVAVVMNGVEYSFVDDYHNEVDIPETLRPFLSTFIEKNNTFYVNAYDVCEKLGATIKNDDGDYAIRYLNNTIEFSLGEYKLYLNGEERDMGGAVAMLDGDELLLPSRYIDSLGARISMYYPEKGRVHPPEEWLITP